MDFIGIGMLVSFVIGLVVVVVIGLVGLRILNRGEKPQAARSMTVGQTHGALFDRVEALGLDLVDGGFVDGPTWQTFFEAFAKKLTQHHPSPAKLNTMDQPAA